MASLMVGALPMTTQSRMPCDSRLSSSQSEIVGVSLRYQTTTSRSLSATSVAPSLLYVYCGRGDKKTAKGKRFNHSFGNSRPRNKRKGRGPPRIPVPSAPPQQEIFEEEVAVQLDTDESESSD